MVPTGWEGMKSGVVAVVVAVVVSPQAYSGLSAQYNNYNIYL
jgi:hypothetical protein